MCNYIYLLPIYACIVQNSKVYTHTHIHTYTELNVLLSINYYIKLEEFKIQILYNEMMDKNSYG